MKTQVISACDLDFDRHVIAFREAFAHVSWREEIEPAMSAEFFRWKYRTPYGDAVIAHIAAGGRLVSSAAAFPLMLRTPVGTHLAWQVGDLITTPDARGQGLFRRCLAALVGELGPKGPLICFPNRLSIGEIQRQGFCCVAELRACVRQTLVVRASNSILVQDSPPAVQAKASDPRSVCVCKDADYLNWRYVRNPARRYQFIAECNSPESFVVVRELALPLRPAGVGRHGIERGRRRRLVTRPRTRSPMGAAAGFDLQFLVLQRVAAARFGQGLYSAPILAPAQEASRIHEVPGVDGPRTNDDVAVRLPDR